MELILDEIKYEVEIVVISNSGLFSDRPNKIGTVQIYGGNGRAVLAMVEQTQMFFNEYPEDCINLQSADNIKLKQDEWHTFDDVIVCLAKGDDGTIMASSVAPGVTHDALKRLQRYATRLVRLDVP